ncbi:MAG: NAD(+) diphosphatase [Lachnospiraceae bacterium]|nr:NAD(+) diphosphatase [Lachnospiraceae bacterium]
MIQEITPKLFHNEFANVTEPPAETDVIFAFQGRFLLCRQEEDGRMVFPSVEDFRPWLTREREESAPSGELLRYLFCIDDTRYYLYRGDTNGYAPETEEALAGFSFEKLFTLRTGYPQDMCFAAITAYHLYVWYRDNTFCGRCGGRMKHSESERAVCCPSCGNIVYPRINPAVIIGLTDGDRIVMTRYAGRETKGNALIAGFCEIGETAEETVRREVMEEVGLEVEDIRYYKSQPWGFELDLLMGFFCKVKGSRDIHMDERELSSAQWIKREDIASDPNGISLTSEMIHHFHVHPEEFA